MDSPHSAEWLAAAKKNHKNIFDLNMFELLSSEDGAQHPRLALGVQKQNERAI